MPIYEFFCRDCNTFFNFFSKKIDTKSRPTCPECKKRKLERQVSRFGLTGNAQEATPGQDELPVDEQKMERAIQALAGEAEGMREDDPRQAARLMRKFTDMTGMELGAPMKEAMGRLEAGEDPEKIEAEMGELMNGEEDPFVLPAKAGKGKGRKGGKARPPKWDTKLYEL